MQVPNNSRCLNRNSKSVSFIKENKYHMIEKLEDYSDIEREKTWYGKEDIIRMQRDAGKKILIETNKYTELLYSNDEDEVEDRGIENFQSYQGYIEMKKKRKSIIREVLRVQEQTKKQKTQDNDVAAIYLCLTRSEKLKAQQYGVYDASDAAKIYINDGILQMPCFSREDEGDFIQIISEQIESQCEKTCLQSLSRGTILMNINIQKIMTQILNYFFQAEYSM